MPIGRPVIDRRPLAELCARRLALEPACRRCARPASEVRPSGSASPANSSRSSRRSRFAEPAPMSAVDLAHLAAQLRELFAATGDRRLARAAAELAPRRARGRRAIDDTLALERMEVLLADPEQTVWRAAWIVAGELGEEPMVARRSTAARLAAKWRRAREMAGG